MIEDFHITNPLFQNQTGVVHGWEIDGEVNLDKNKLEFGLEKTGQYIIKSFIPIVSEQINYEISLDLKVTEQLDKKDSKNGLIMLQLYPEPKVEL